MPRKKTKPITSVMAVTKRSLAVTLFGPFDRARAMKLLDLADVFFAEFGAEGGPALRDPFDKAIDALEGNAKKKKKKKKKPALDEATGSLEPATNPEPSVRAPSPR